MTACSNVVVCCVSGRLPTAMFHEGIHAYHNFRLLSLNRSQTKSSDSPAPRAKPRSQPTLPQPSAPASTQEYNDELNSFGSPDSEASLTPEPRKDLSNPFDECDTASEENEPENPFGDEEETTAPESTYTNPFGDEEETEKPPTDRRQTVNIVSPNETRLNPFTDEYEKKKLSKPVKAGETPPKPPSRKKNAAPPPPASPSKSPAHGGAPRVKPPQPGSPQRRHKKPAPTWKDDVERKMEEVNAANKSDQRYFPVLACLFYVAAERYVTNYRIYSNITRTRI